MKYNNFRKKEKNPIKFGVIMREKKTEKNPIKFYDINIKTSCFVGSVMTNSIKRYILWAQL